ncbi:MAG: hydrogenase maturation nickel metallochaperone HypA [Oscillospiraceae bacterium]|nr:hydrogenase maturation nickel metallochaperone HypA [Oscillospiraceae bacterium]
MHELGTVFYVIEQVEKICRENDLTVVGSVTLEIGEVSGIIPEYIVDCWNWARAKSEFMKTAELKIENLEAVTYCEDCQKTYPTLKYKKICPYCGSEHTYLLTGNEYNIKEIEAM